MTLVELLVVLAVLGVMAGVVGLAWQPGRWELAGDRVHTRDPIATVRRRAMESGRVIKAVVTLGSREAQIIAFPDGRVVGAERFGEVIPWLIVNRGGLTVFAHAETGEDLADHTQHVIWFGPSERLDLSIF